MTNDGIRTLCLSLPHATEVVQWGEHLLFKVGGKMFCIITLDGHSCTFRCDPERYAELVEMPDIAPASHNMWKYQWVTTETLTALPDSEFRELLTGSYRIVRGTLPRRVQAELDRKGQEGKSEVSSRKSETRRSQKSMATSPSKVRRRNSRTR